MHDKNQFKDQPTKKTSITKTSKNNQLTTATAVATAIASTCITTRTRTTAAAATTTTAATAAATPSCHRSCLSNIFQTKKEQFKSWWICSWNLSPYLHQEVKRSTKVSRQYEKLVFKTRASPLLRIIRLTLKPELSRIKQSKTYAIP